jgi:outer membrane cobalamin receptor
LEIAMRKHRLTLALAGPILSALTASAQTLSPAAAPATPEAPSLSEVTVTGNRENTLLLQTPASVGVIGTRAIQRTGPMHPQQILNQVPGVAIAVTNGEGHSTAIRQPFTTSPVYLFLEDGIPIRATGFFNHNALYEVNIPQASGIEVVKGPGSALYGSDAIGGTVNILTKAPSVMPGVELSGEAGSFGWQRLLLDGTLATGKDGAARAAVNLTHTDGWRAKTAYDRQSVSLRHDQALSDVAMLKTILGYTKIDQQTGANSALTYNDYLNNPTKNNLSIAYRKVDALRLSSAYERDMGAALLSITERVLQPEFRPAYREIKCQFPGSHEQVAAGFWRRAQAQADRRAGPGEQPRYAHRRQSEPHQQRHRCRPQLQCLHGGQPHLRLQGHVQECLGVPAGRGYATARHVADRWFAL